MINLPKITGSDISSDIHNLCNKFPGKVVFTTSFGLEDQVITDIIYKHKLPVQFITLDTGRLFEETYRVFSHTLERYQIEIETLHPDAAELSLLLKNKGPFSFYESVENRKECCNIRKVKPLKKALENYLIWITGLRSGQSESRASLKLIGIDENYGIIKYNPLLNWSFDEVREYIREKNVPYNAMHDHDFPSIGCAPCTRALNNGEEIRSGRWWWEGNNKKECGLHTEK
jgi:phosphoadenosine phosphosulfate reductase